MSIDYLDLYQVNGWDDVTPLEEILSILDQLVQDGKVRYICARNYTVWHLQKAIDLSQHYGCAQFISSQPLYNLIDRETEWDLIPVCQAEGSGILTWCPLRSRVTSTIIGARTPTHLVDNLRAVEFILDDAQITKLNFISKKELLVPYNFIHSRKG